MDYQSIYQSKKKSPGTPCFRASQDLQLLLKLGKSKDDFKHICLVFICFLPLFYLCYIYYFGLLIFCCQFVAISL